MKMILSFIVTVIPIFLLISFDEGFSEELENTYTNEIMEKNLGIKNEAESLVENATSSAQQVESIITNGAQSAATGAAQQVEGLITGEDEPAASKKYGGSNFVTEKISQTALKEYKSDPIGVKIKIPLEWTIFEEKNSTKECFEEFKDCRVTILNSNIFSGADFNIIIDKATKDNLSLTDFLSIQYDDLKSSVEGFIFINDRETKLQNYPAWELEYSFTTNDELYKLLLITTKVNNTFYLLGYSPIKASDYSKYLPEAQNILKSIEFIPSIPQESISQEIREPSFLKQSNMKKIPFSESLNNLTSEQKSDIANKLIKSNTATQDTQREEIAMKIKFEPHENQYLEDYFQVSDFAFAASNSSKLCPTVTCGYELVDGEMQAQFTAGERTITGKFKVDTGEFKNIMNMRGSWEAVQEREVNGELVQVIEGKLGMGKNQFSPEFEYEINGTLTTDDDGYILQVIGLKK